MKKKSNYRLDKEKADEMLNNILDTCNLPPTSDTLETDMLIHSLQRRKIFVFKIIAIFFLIVAVISPLFFKADPSFMLINSSKTVVVASHMLYEDCFVMTLSGDADFENIYAKKNDGALVYPDQADSSSGVVILPYNGDALNIYIPTKSGECIQAVLNETK